MNKNAKYYEEIGDKLTGAEQERAYRHAQNALDPVRDLEDWKRIQAKLVSNLRGRAAAKSHAARWGEARGESRQIRVSVAAAEALQRVPERDRRELASRAILDAVTRTV